MHAAGRRSGSMGVMRMAREVQTWESSLEVLRSRWGERGDMMLSMWKSNSMDRLSYNGVWCDMHYGILNDMIDYL